jgi:SSS family transporter
MSVIDFSVIVVYVLVCTGLGVWLGTTTQGLKGYFLGERDIPAWAVMISIVATETSTATVLSVPGVSYRGDLTYLQLAMGYLLGRVVVATVLLPSYFRKQLFTAYQVLNERFGGATKTTASLLFLVTRTLGDGLRLFLAALVLRELTGWRMSEAIVAMSAATIVYTYLGGMKAVIWTDVIQFGIYIVGAVVALYVLVGEIDGGWDRIIDQARAAGKLRLFDFRLDLSLPFTFWAGLIGGMVLNTATHGADQLMVQRYLSARSQGQAAGALIASGFVVLVQFALFLLIGVALFVLNQDQPPSQPPRPDGEFIAFIGTYMPVGLKGLVVAAIFSAAMSTLSGSLNSSASTTVNDLYLPLAPQASEAHLLRLSKGLTVVWGVAQMGVAFAAIGLRDNVVNNALAIASFTTGIVLGLFLLGVLTRRVGQTSALIGLIAGVLAVSYVKFGPMLPEWGAPRAYPFSTALAWPWYALVGSSTVVIVGLLASLVWPASPLSPSRGVSA